MARLKFDVRNSNRNINLTTASKRIIMRSDSKEESAG